MPTTDGPIDLETFAAANGRRHATRWVDQLPEDIRQQILNSSVGPTVICNWLKSLGYADATVNRVAALVRDRQANG